MQEVRCATPSSSTHRLVALLSAGAPRPIGIGRSDALRRCSSTSDESDNHTIVCNDLLSSPIIVP